MPEAAAAKYVEKAFTIVEKIRSQRVNNAIYLAVSGCLARAGFFPSASPSTSKLPPSRGMLLLLVQSRLEHIYPGQSIAVDSINFHEQAMHVRFNSKEAAVCFLKAFEDYAFQHDKADELCVSLLGKANIDSFIRHECNLDPTTVYQAKELGNVTGRDHEKLLKNNWL